MVFIEEILSEDEVEDVLQEIREMKEENARKDDEWFPEIHHEAYLEEKERELESDEEQYVDTDDMKIKIRKGSSSDSTICLTGRLS